MSKRLREQKHEAAQAVTKRGNRAWIFGNLLVTTCLQGAGAPLVDRCALPFALWDARYPELGICAACLALTAPNRGGCSHTRGCDCTQDGVSWRIRDAEQAADRRSSEELVE